MVDTRHPLCKNEQCTRQPSFGMEVRRSIPLSWGRKRRKIVGVGGLGVSARAARTWGPGARGGEGGGGSTIKIISIFFTLYLFFVSHNPSEDACLIEL